VRATLCAPSDGWRAWRISATSSSPPRGGVPVRVKDIAEVQIGRELRTGSTSENGRETVIGTALMLLGGNSRAVSAAVDAKMAEINRTLPPDIEAKTVLNRTLLVDATVKTVAKNLIEGAHSIILVLFLLLGNFRVALITALVIPVAMLMMMTGMMAGKNQRQPDEPRRARLWSDRGRGSDNR
jgi:cobalt-zinc-cadmium resistance protein CzcA